MTPSQAYKDEPFRFCDLPPEIRNMIYRLLLVKEKDIRRTELCGYRFQYAETWSVFSKPPNKREPRLQPAILLANRHINEEALAILYRENYFGVYVGPGRILHSNFLAFTDLQYLQAHPHFPLVRKLHARVDVSAFENLDETDHIGGLRAGVRRLVLTLLDRKPLAVLKISLLFGRLFDLGEKVYERMFEPLTLLQDLNRLEVMSKLFESLPNTLRLLREHGTLVTPFTDNGSRC